MKNAAFILLASLVISAPIASASTPDPICPRLASQLGLKQPTSGTKDSGNVWSTDTASLGMHLFGGSTATSISLTPLEGAETGAFLSEEEACTYTSKGVSCRVEGPAHLKMRTRTATAAIDVRNGERAEVEIRNTKVICEDLL
ncbi:MAG: hypothetical protein EOO38_03695 [Cytophagaceae bacterium]|nr:MAG: hypothetical protein EOO38_03695 [Cytophagaceae bacterium]